MTLNDDARVSLLVRSDERQEGLLLRICARVLRVHVNIAAADVADADIAMIVECHMRSKLVISQSANHIAIKFDNPMVRRLTEFRLVPLADLSRLDVPTLWSCGAMDREVRDGAKLRHFFHPI